MFQFVCSPDVLCFSVRAREGGEKLIPLAGYYRGGRGSGEISATLNNSICAGDTKSEKIRKKDSEENKARQDKKSKALLCLFSGTCTSRAALDNCTTWESVKIIACTLHCNIHRCLPLHKSQQSRLEATQWRDIHSRIQQGSFTNHLAWPLFRKTPRDSVSVWTVERKIFIHFRILFFQYSFAIKLSYLSYCNPL